MHSLHYSDSLSQTVVGCPPTMRSDSADVPTMTTPLSPLCIVWLDTRMATSSITAVEGKWCCTGEDRKE